MFALPLVAVHRHPPSGGRCPPSSSFRWFPSTVSGHESLFSAYGGTIRGEIPAARMEVIDKLTGGDPGSPSKRLKTFVLPGIETILDLSISKFISKLQVHMNHSAEVIFGSQYSISLLNSNIVDLTEDHTTIWCAIRNIMKKFISHGTVTENIDLDLLMKDAREAHLLTVNIKAYVDYDMAQETPAPARVRYISATLTQLVTPGAGGCLDSMHHAVNVGDQNIGVLQQTFTDLFNLVGTLEQKCIICIRMVHLS